MVDPDSIAEIVGASRRDLQAATRGLIRAANDAGGEDNITAVMFEIVGASDVEAVLPPVGYTPTPAPSPDDPALVAAARTVPGRRFLGWARFPMVQLERRAEGDEVHLVDLRYRESAGPGFAAVSVPLPATRR